MTDLSESCDDCDETSDEDSLTEDGEDDEDDEGDFLFIDRPLAFGRFNVAVSMVVKLLNFVIF